MKTKIVKGKICGTCRFWGRDGKNNKAILPNSFASCDVHVDIPKDAPLSLLKKGMLCMDGRDCPTWENCGYEVRIIK